MGINVDIGLAALQEQARQARDDFYMDMGVEDPPPTVEVGTLLRRLQLKARTVRAVQAFQDGFYVRMISPKLRSLRFEMERRWALHAQVYFADSDEVWVRAPWVATSFVFKRCGMKILTRDFANLGLIFDPEYVRFVMGAGSDMDSVSLLTEPELQPCQKRHGHSTRWSRRCVLRVIDFWKEHGFDQERRWHTTGRAKQFTLGNLVLADDKPWYDRVHYSLQSFRESGDDCLLRRKKHRDSRTYWEHNEVLIWPEGDWWNGIADALMGYYLPPHICASLLEARLDPMEKDAEKLQKSLATWQLYRDIFVYMQPGAFMTSFDGKSLEPCIE